MISYPCLHFRYLSFLKDSFLDILSVPLFGQFPIPGQASSSSYPARLYINQNMNIWECNTKAALVKHLPFSRVSESFFVLMQRSGVHFRYINIYSFFKASLPISISPLPSLSKIVKAWGVGFQGTNICKPASTPNHMDLIESFCEAIFATKHLVY